MLPPDIRLAKLRWQCRRGMLELDLLLNYFLDKHFSQLSPQKQQEFERLLCCTDQELFNWLIHHEVPKDSNFAELIGYICHVDKNTL